MIQELRLYCLVTDYINLKEHTNDSIISSVQFGSARYYVPLFIEKHLLQNKVFTYHVVDIYVYNKPFLDKSSEIFRVVKMSRVVNVHKQ